MPIPKGKIPGIHPISLLLVKSNAKCTRYFTAEGAESAKEEQDSKKVFPGALGVLARGGVEKQ